MTSDEFFDRHPEATSEDYKKYLTKIIAELKLEKENYEKLQEKLKENNS